MIASGPNGPALAKAAFIAGDSAGGGLALASMLALRDRGRQLPKGGILISGFVDLTLTSESIQSQSTNELYMHPSSLPKFVQLYIGTADVRNPLVSPILGDFTGIPRLLIQVGERCRREKYEDRRAGAR